MVSDRRGFGERLKRQRERSGVTLQQRRDERAQQEHEDPEHDEQRERDDELVVAFRRLAQVVLLRRRAADEAGLAVDRRRAEQRQSLRPVDRLRQVGGQRARRQRLTRLRRRTRFGWCGAGAAQNMAARDHEIAVRGDREQVEPLHDVEAEMLGLDVEPQHEQRAGE